MSGLGILASALGGGAAAIGEQAKGDIAQQRETELAQQKAAIQEQMEMRLMEAKEKYRQQGVLADNTGPLAQAKLDYAKREGEQRSQQAIDQARSMIPVTQEAAKAAAQTESELAKERASDPIYLGAVAKIKLADPEVAARIAASRASAGASAASAAESRERTEGLKLGNEDKRKLDKLYGDAGAILADPSITDEERAKRYSKVQSQIMLMKSKTGQVKERDPELDTVTVTDEKMNPDGTTTKTTRKEVRRPGNSSSAAATGAPAVGEEVNGYVFKGGNPNDKKNWEPKKGGGMIPATAQAVSTNKAPDYQPMSDGSGRMVDATTGRTLTAEQSAVLVKIQRGEPTTPRERALLND